MKIFVIDNLTTSLLPGRESAAGLERVAKNDALFLAQAGHDVTFFYAGEHRPELEKTFPFKAVWINKYSHEEIRRGVLGLHINTWNKQISATLCSMIQEQDPDVFLYHGYTLSWAKAILKRTKVPLLYTVHGFISDNFMYHSNRVKDYVEVVKLGGTIVANTNTTKVRIEAQIERLHKKNVKSKGLEAEYPWMGDVAYGRVKLFNGGYHNNFMFVEQKYDILETTGEVIVASRAFEPKAVHKFHDIGVPTKVFWKEHVDTDQAWIEKQVARFKANPNIEFFWNHPYEQIMQHFRTSKVCLVTWPDETFGLTAFEAAQFGVPSIVFNKDEPHASHEFMSRIHEPRIISYKDGNFKEQTLDAISEIDTSMEFRTHIAERFAEVYNRDDFIAERMRLIALAKGIRQSKTIDMFTF